MRQKVITGTVRPGIIQVSGWSRVISVYTVVKVPVPGLENFGLSQPFGNRFVLEKVQVRFNPLQEAGGASIDYGFHVGSGRPGNVITVQGWRPILPVHTEAGILYTWSQYERSNPDEWDMEQLFEGDALRFGIWLRGNAIINYCEMVASFRIREV